ncbi:hypothetical protein MVEN_00464200 [Mycena venus]|uniref:Uncharacterized protein n=1 Tax=Mycena venus TaxID=2733690 RepID=A0A8H7DAS5_9AGAR|nr:hypothetical protein MVEN_00464200 [Mycena venus]
MSMAVHIPTYHIGRTKPRSTFTETRPSNVSDDSGASYCMTKSVPEFFCQPGAQVRPRIVLFHWFSLRLHHMDHSSSSILSCYSTRLLPRMHITTIVSLLTRSLFWTLVLRFAGRDAGFDGVNAIEARERLEELGLEWNPAIFQSCEWCDPVAEEAIRTFFWARAGAQRASLPT